MFNDGISVNRVPLKWQNVGGKLNWSIDELLKYNTINSKANNYTISLNQFDEIIPVFDIDVNVKNRMDDTRHSEVLDRIETIFENVIKKTFSIVQNIVVYRRSFGAAGGLHIHLPNLKTSPESLRLLIKQKINPFFSSRLFDRKTQQHLFPNYTIKLDTPACWSLPGYSKTGSLNDAYCEQADGNLEPFPYNTVMFNYESLCEVEASRPDQWHTQWYIVENLIEDIHSFFILDFHYFGSDTISNDTPPTCELLSKDQLYIQIMMKQYRLEPMLIAFIVDRLGGKIEFDFYVNVLIPAFGWYQTHNTSEEFLAFCDMQYRLFSELKIIADSTTFKYMFTVIILLSEDYWIVPKVKPITLPMLNLCYISHHVLECLNLIVNVAKATQSVDRQSIIEPQDSDSDSFDDEYESQPRSKRKKPSLRQVKRQTNCMFQTVHQLLTRCFVIYAYKDKGMALWFLDTWYKIPKNAIVLLVKDLFLASNIPIEYYMKWEAKLPKCIANICDSWFQLKDFEAPFNRYLLFANNDYYTFNSGSIFCASCPLMFTNIEPLGEASSYFLYGYNKAKKLVSMFDDMFDEAIDCKDEQLKILNITLKYIYCFSTGSKSKSISFIYHIICMALFKMKKQILHLYGATAHNGKSFMVDCLQRALTTYMRPISLSSIKNSAKETHPDLIAARRCSIIYLDESTATTTKDKLDFSPQMLKIFTGGARQYMRTLYDEGLAIQFNFNLITTANVVYNSLDPGLLRRIVTFPCLAKLDERAHLIDCVDQDNWDHDAKIVKTKRFFFKTKKETSLEIISKGIHVLMGIFEAMGDELIHIWLHFFDEVCEKILEHLDTRLDFDMPGTVSYQRFNRLCDDILQLNYKYVPAQFHSMIIMKIMNALKETHSSDEKGFANCIIIETNVFDSMI